MTLFFGVACVTALFAASAGPGEEAKEIPFVMSVLRVDNKKSVIQIYYRFEHKGKGIVRVFRCHQVGEVCCYSKMKRKTHEFRLLLDEDFILGKSRVIEGSLTLRGEFGNDTEIEIELMGVKSKRVPINRPIQ